MDLHCISLMTLATLLTLAWHCYSLIFSSHYKLIFALDCITVTLALDCIPVCWSLKPPDCGRPNLKKRILLDASNLGDNIKLWIVPLCVSVCTLRRLRGSNVSVNVYPVNEPWLYSVLWCSGIQSVSSDAPHILRKVPQPIWLMVSDETFSNH